MRGLLWAIFVGSVIVCYTIYAITGCSGSRNSTSVLEKYDGEPYFDAAVFPGQHDAVFQCAILALQEEGYLITLSDPQNRIVSGELNCPAKLQEELRGQTPERQTNVVKTCLAFLVIIGFAIAFLGSIGNGSTDENSSPLTNDPQPNESYKYTASLTTCAISTDSVEVKIAVTRSDLTDDLIVNTVPLENKYINCEIFDAIYRQLKNR